MAPSGPQTAIAASITSVSPAALTAGSAHQTITVTGTNFAAGLTVSLAPAGGSAITVSGTDIANVTATAFQASVVVAAAGAYSLQVTNPGASASNAVSLPVMPAAAKVSPAITSITPASIIASPTPQLITLHGTNFVPGLTLGYALGSGSTSVVSGGQIANVTPTSFDVTLTIFPGGTYTFSVTNPDASVSNRVTTTVTSSAAQTATLFSVTPDPIVARSSPQTVGFSGKNFAAGLTMIATSDTGATVTASGSQISNLTSQLFSATVTIATAGQYTIQIVNPGVAPSNALVENIGGAGSQACAATAAPPYVGNISGLPVPQAVFSESATDVGFYAQIYENLTPSILCGGGLGGPCPWLDSCVVGGACQGPVQVLCGCISGGLEVHFKRTAASGSCSATLAVHDVCGVSGTSTLTFALPPPPTPFDALMRILNGVPPTVPLTRRR